MKSNPKSKAIFFAIVITLFIGITLPVKSQEKSHKSSVKGSIPQKLSVKNMQADMTVLWSAIKEIHPGYNYYTPADSLKKAYDQVYSSINKPLYEIEFISHIYSFICKLRCGHTLAKEYHFDGNLYVLIDVATFSSGALFTAALKSNRNNVTFIGRETAGSEEGCNGMVMQELTLSNTKIMVDFPWMRVESVALSSFRGRGIMPDYKVDYDPLDIVTKKDHDIEKAMELIK